ncbi:hypothetical protein D3C71_2001890 [compost metagenome]
MEVSVNQLLTEILLMVLLLTVLTIVQVVEVLLAIFAMPATLLRALGRILGG